MVKHTLLQILRAFVDQNELREEKASCKYAKCACDCWECQVRGLIWTLEN